MKTNPYAPIFDDLPEILPIFPLSGVLLLPLGELPLNLFEPRYLAMADEAMRGSRMIGMVQPCTTGNADALPKTYQVGCAGKIIDFQETEDGRYLVTLSGIIRFRIAEELELQVGGYRAVRPDWSGYENDIHQRQCLKLDRSRLKDSLRRYFDLHSMECDWDAVDSAPDGKLITCLSMICPFSASEKQALLEANCCEARSELFIKMLDMETSFACKGGCKGH